MKKFAFGKRYRDKITGFEGAAVARSEYLNGCIQISLERLNEKDGTVQDMWFDEQRLEDVETRESIETTATAGGPQRQSDPWR